MEDLVRMVADSLARHGYDAPVDHRRLEWSRWFRCESSLSLLLVPSSPGIYALGEDLGWPGAPNPVAASSRAVMQSDGKCSPNESKARPGRVEEDPTLRATPELERRSNPVSRNSADIGSKRILAVFEIADADDLSVALARLFAPGHPLRDRLASGHCFARFARVSDPDQRHAASSALREWLASSMELATSFGFSSP